MVDELIKVIEETEYHYNEVQSIPLICNSDMTMNLTNKQHLHQLLLIMNQQYKLTIRTFHMDSNHRFHILVNEESSFDDAIIITTVR